VADDLRFVRAHHRHLSLWQSVVAERTHEQLNATGSPTGTLATSDHPLATGVNDHVEAVMAGTLPEEPPPGSEDVRAIHAWVSYQAFELALALVEEDAERAERFATEVRKFSDADREFIIKCAADYAFYYLQHGGIFKYNDWRREGGGNINYGVIQWRLPNDAKVGIVGDWGTGLDDAKKLLFDLCFHHRPAAIIHLGDIYYSGTAAECRTNYTEIIDEVFEDVYGPGGRIPVFTLFGNHDYYALGYPLHDMLATINEKIPGARQVASYFCLQTQDFGWQFLAMDSGRHDANPEDQIDPRYAGPWLEANEAEWLDHKVRTFSGATVLLSHHQLFSANSKLNGWLSAYRDLPYLNPYLNKVFAPYYETKIAAWLWGHEHNFAVYRDGLFGLAKGRLVGCSAYEEAASADPYKINYPQVDYQRPTDWMLKADDEGYYEHGYAVIDLAKRKTPKGPIGIDYYAFPSWGSIPARGAESRHLLHEDFEHPSEVPPAPLYFGQHVTLYAEEGLFVSDIQHWEKKNYPRLSSEDRRLRHELVGSSPDGIIRHGSTVQLRSNSPLAPLGLLGAWSTTALYYWGPGYKEQNWTIYKRDQSDPVVHWDDEVAFINQSWSGQSIRPYWSTVWSGNYLTTKSGTYWWVLRR
jgi:hypothetical protein